MKSFTNMVAFELRLQAEEHSLLEESREDLGCCWGGGQYFLGMVYTTVNWYCHPCLCVLVALRLPGHPRVPRCTPPIPAM